MPMGPHNLQPASTDDTDGEPQHLVTNMVIARESDADDLILLEGMIHQTLDRYRKNLAHYKKLKALGIRPVHELGLVEGTQEIVTSQGKSVVFEISDDETTTVCIYSRGSAAKENEYGENDFEQLVAAKIADYRPENVRVATFSRLVRSSFFSGDIERALRRAKSKLYYGESTPIDLTTDAGDLMWKLLVHFSHIERNQIAQRLFLGTLAAFRRGEWISTSSAVPFGYDLDENRRLIVDPEAKHVVQKVVHLLGEPGLTRSRMMELLGEVRLTTPGRSGKWNYDKTWRYVEYTAVGDPHNTGRRATNRRRRDTESLEIELTQDATSVEPNEFAEVLSQVDDQDERGEILTDQHRVDDIENQLFMHKRLAKYLDLWEHGTFTLYRRIVLDGLTTWGEFPVWEPRIGPKHKYFKLTYEGDHLKHPDGEWAPAAEFAAARERTRHLTDPDLGSPEDTQTKNLFIGGFTRWQDETDAWKLTSISKARLRCYELLSQPHDPRSRERITWKTGTGNLKQGVVKHATVGMLELHSAIADSISAAFENGAEVERLGTDSHHRQELVRRALIGDVQSKLKEHKKALENATAEYTALRETDPGLAEPSRRKALKHARKVKKLRARKRELKASRLQLPPEDLSLDPADLAYILAGIRTCDWKVPPEIGQALGRVIRDFRLTYDGLEAHFSLRLLLSTGSGPILFGPITGSVAAEPPRGQHAPSPEEQQAAREATGRELSRHLLTTDSLPSNFVRERGRHSSGMVLARAAAESLTACGLQRDRAAAIIAAVPLVTRQIIWSQVNDTEPPEDATPGFVRAVTDSYLGSDLPQLTGSWLRLNWPAMALMDRLRQSGPEPVGSVREWLTECGAYPSTTDNLIQSHSEQLPVRLHQHVANTWEHEQGLVTLFSCPHADCNGKLDQYSGVPENPRGLLCSTCRRNPLDPTLIYPTDYINFTASDAIRRLKEVNPSARGKLMRNLEPSPNLRAVMWKWTKEEATRNGSSARGLAEPDQEKFLKAVADGQVACPLATREWASFHGHEIGRIGVIRADIRAAFRRAFHSEPEPAE